MARGNSVGKIDPALEKAIGKLLKDTVGDKTASLKDKALVIGMGLKLAAIKAKMNDQDWGSGFAPEPEDKDGAD
jgi:hypothetical protein